MHHGHHSNHGLALTPMMTCRPQAISTFLTKVDCCDKGRGALLVSGIMVGVPAGPVDTILAAASLRRRANRYQGVGIQRNWYSTPKKVHSHGRGRRIATVSDNSSAMRSPPPNKRQGGRRDAPRCRTGLCEGPSPPH